MNDVLKSRKRISHFEQDNAQIKEIKIYVEQVSLQFHSYIDSLSKNASRYLMQLMVVMFGHLL